MTLKMHLERNTSSLFQVLKEHMKMLLIFTGCCGKQEKMRFEKRSFVFLGQFFSPCCPAQLLRESEELSWRPSCCCEVPGAWWCRSELGWQKHSPPSWWLCTSASSPLFIKPSSDGKAAHVHPTYTCVVYNTGAILTAAVWHACLFLQALTSPRGLTDYPYK